VHMALNWPSSCVQGALLNPGRDLLGSKTPVHARHETADCQTAGYDTGTSELFT
jgi:hypothetical protein